MYNYDFQYDDPRRPLMRAGRARPYTDESEPYTHPGDLLNYASFALPNPLVAVYRAGAMGRAALAAAKKRSALRAAMDPAEAALTPVLGGF